LEVQSASRAFLHSLEALDQLSMLQLAVQKMMLSIARANCCAYKIAGAELDDPGVGVLAGEMVT